LVFSVPCQVAPDERRHLCQEAMDHRVRAHARKLPPASLQNVFGEQSCFNNLRSRMPMEYERM
jgi:hypothetical protein